MVMVIVLLMLVTSGVALSGGYSDDADVAVVVTSDAQFEKRMHVLYLAGAQHQVMMVSLMMVMYWCR